MFENFKWYVVNVVAKKYLPIAAMSGITALGGLWAAHEGVMEQWGVNFIQDWTPAWLTTHAISGPILLIELDTTSTAALAALVGLITLLSRAGEHHAMVNMPPAAAPVLKA